MVEAGASLNYVGGVHTFAGDVVGTGGGTVNVATTWQVPEAASFNFPGDMLQWGAATYTFNGVATNVGTINISGSTVNLAGTLNNESLIVHTSNDLNFNSATINNRAGGVYELQSGQLDANTGTFVFNNEGLFRSVPDSSVTIDTDFINSGVIELKEGSLLNFTRSLSLQPASTIRTELGGTTVADYGRLNRTCLLYTSPSPRDS